MLLSALFVPIRGCISYEKLYEIEQPNFNMLIGNPIIEAYEYEEKMNSLGIILGPSIIVKDKMATKENIKNLS